MNIDNRIPCVYVMMHECICICVYAQKNACFTIVINVTLISRMSRIVECVISMQFRLIHFTNVRLYDLPALHRVSRYFVASPAIIPAKVKEILFKISCIICIS